MEREKFGSRLGFILISAGCAIGIPNIRRNNIYNKTNIPPPLLPATYGKRHTFPIPIAQPALISMNPSLLPNFSLSIVL